MESDYFRSNIKFFALPLAVALVACFEPIVMGYPQGNDWILELVRIVEYHAALSSGQFPPYWAADLYRGFGSPIFVFYAPLYLASASLLMSLGLSVTAAATVVLVFFTMLAAVGVAGLCREILGRDKPAATGAAHVAAVIFVLAPYFMADMLIRNANAEFVALCLVPYPFWGLALIYRGNRHGFPLLVLAFMFVILAHNLTALMVSALLLVISLFLFRNRRAVLLQSAVAMLFAIGLSCWFWLAALGLKDRVRIGEMTQGRFDFHNNFIPLTEMFGYDGVIAVGWVIPVILLISVVSFVRGNRTPLLAGLLVAGVSLVILQTSMSALVWENIPLLPLFQFPWRMFGPLSLVIAILGGLLFHKYLPHRRFSKWIIIILIAANAVPLMRQYEPLSEKYRQMIVDSVNPSGVQQRGLTATVIDEYLPRGAQKIVSERVPPGTVILPGSVSSKVQRVGNTNIEIETEFDNQGVVHIARWYFPGWRFTINSAEDSMLVDRFGNIKIDVPAGKHQIRLWMTQPALRQWGLWVSGATAVLLVLLLVGWQRGWKCGYIFKNGDEVDISMD